MQQGSVLGCTLEHRCPKSRHKRKEERECEKTKFYAVTPFPKTLYLQLLIGDVEGRDNTERTLRDHSCEVPKMIGLEAGDGKALKVPNWHMTIKGDLVVHDPDPRRAAVIVKDGLINARAVATPAFLKNAGAAETAARAETFESTMVSKYRSLIMRGAYLSQGDTATQTLQRL